MGSFSDETFEIVQDFEYGGHQWKKGTMVRISPYPGTTHRVLQQTGCRTYIGQEHWDMLCIEDKIVNVKRVNKNG